MLMLQQLHYFSPFVQFSGDELYVLFQLSKHLFFSLIKGQTLRRGCLPKTLMILWLILELFRSFLFSRCSSIPTAICAKTSFLLYAS